MSVNDFQVNLLKCINSISSLNYDLVARIDYFTENDDIVVNVIAGGKVLREYMDGTREVLLPFEIAVKCKENEKANNVIWNINNLLSDFDLKIDSENDSYIFLKLVVDKPQINGRDEQGFYIYSLNIEAMLEI